jgi:hypothetical protein
MPAPPAPLNPPQAFKQRVNELNLAREMLHRSEGVSGAGLSQNAKLLLGTLATPRVTPYHRTTRAYTTVTTAFNGSVSSRRIIARKE